MGLGFEVQHSAYMILGSPSYARCLPQLRGSHWGLSSKCMVAKVLNVSGMQCRTLKKYQHFSLIILIQLYHILPENLFKAATVGLRISFKAPGGSFEPLRGDPPAVAAFLRVLWGLGFRIYFGSHASRLRSFRRCSSSAGRVSNPSLSQLV